MVEYDGDFVDGEFNGNGGQLLNNHEWYIGQFKNNKKEGKERIRKRKIKRC